jgi:hypothetical protein
MGIVSFALRFGHTFYVLAWMMLFLGGSAILTTPPPTGGVTKRQRFELRRLQ